MFPSIKSLIRRNIVALIRYIYFHLCYLLLTQVFLTHTWVHIVSCSHTPHTGGHLIKRTLIQQQRKYNLKRCFLLKSYVLSFVLLILFFDARRISLCSYRDYRFSKSNVSLSSQFTICYKPEIPP